MMFWDALVGYACVQKGKAFAIGCSQIRPISRRLFEAVFFLKTTLVRGVPRFEKLQFENLDFFGKFPRIACDQRRGIGQTNVVFRSDHENQES